MQGYALPGIGEITPESDLAFEIRSALARIGLALQAGDVLVVAQKIISKKEGRLRSLSTVVPSSEALALAARVRKDPRFVELVLQESSAVVRAVPDILITRHRQGFVMANAGIDRSNLAPPESGSMPALEDDRVLLLPVDCDASATRLRAALAPDQPAVIISDSFGRPWRQGVVNVALGVAGLVALRDQRGETDRHGRVMQTTQVAVADAIAAAAGLLMGESTEGQPVVLLRGLPDALTAQPVDDRKINAMTVQSLIRPLEQDLFA